MKVSFSEMEKSEEYSMDDVKSLKNRKVRADDKARNETDDTLEVPSDETDGRTAEECVDREKTFLNVRDLSAGYGKKEILSGISFSAAAGEMIGIIGENGCGKTTLLKALCGILPSEGEIFLDGCDLKKLSVKARARLTGYIPQRSGISISVSVKDAVLMGLNPQLSLLQYPGDQMKKRADEVLKTVGLSERASSDYQELSEGQKQLCMLARTLISGCRLLLLDEPESALDFGGRYRMMDLLKDCVRQADGIALLSLHDPVLALYACDRLLMIRDGKLCGTVMPAKESEEAIAEKFSLLYGPVSVHRIPDRQGIRRLILIREG